MDYTLHMIQKVIQKFYGEINFSGSPIYFRKNCRPLKGRALATPLSKNVETKYILIKIFVTEICVRHFIYSFFNHLKNKVSYVDAFLSYIDYNRSITPVYTCNFSRCDCHPGVCNKLMTVYAARYPLMIHYSLSSTVSSVKHILQDASRIAQNRMCKQPL